MTTNSKQTNQAIKQLEERNRFIKRAILLSFLTIGYNLIEGVVSIYFGISDEAISLAGFGGDSLIEVGSAGLVLWRLEAEAGMNAELSLLREKKATFGIGVLFIILAIVTLIASTFQLATFSHPESTLPGLIIAALSLSLMFFLWSAKRKVAIALDSATVMKDADCSMACIKLSAILFIGSLIFLLFPGLWWIDSAAAILLAIIIGKEGYDTIQATRREDFSGGCGCAR